VKDTVSLAITILTGYRLRHSYQLPADPLMLSIRLPSVGPDRPSYHLILERFLTDTSHTPDPPLYGLPLGVDCLNPRSPTPQSLPGQKSRE
jgi:hypothetical protein